MNEVVSIGQLTEVVNGLKNIGKSIVLAGGCFDILHPGHVIFLEKAKKAGDVLMVLLESDEKIKLLKGINRPVHSQKERAQVLSALHYIDYVVLLPVMKKDADYDQLVIKIKPDVIAATARDKNIHYYQRTAKLVGAKVRIVTKEIGSYSTTSLIGSITVKCNR